MGEAYKWPTKSDGVSADEYERLLRIHLKQDFDSEEGKAVASQIHEVSLKLTKPEVARLYGIYFEIRDETRRPRRA